MGRRPRADHVAQNVGLAQATICSAGARQTSSADASKAAGGPRPFLSTSPPAARILNAAREGGVTPYRPACTLSAAMSASLRKVITPI